MPVSTERLSPAPGLTTVHAVVWWLACGPLPLLPALTPAVAALYVVRSRAMQIDALPEWAQLAFAGYKTLNRIQSRIFQTAFTSNENMLVCAPTGETGSIVAHTSALKKQ